MESRYAKAAIKKIVRSGKGLVVFITTEARKLNMNEGDYITVFVGEDSKGKIITLRKLEMK